MAIAQLAFWLLAGWTRSGALWVLDLLKRSELARWALAALVVWALWGIGTDRAYDRGVAEERGRWERASQEEAARQKAAVERALADYQAMAKEAQADAARWERQASLAEARAAVLAGNKCLPKEVVDAIKDIR